MSSDSPKTLKKRLPFCLKSLKPNDDDDVEYQFEELRAHQYYVMYEK